MAFYSGFTHWKWRIFPVRYGTVYQRVIPVSFSEAPYFRSLKVKKKNHQDRVPGGEGMMSRNQRIVQTGWRIFIAHEDKVDVVSPFSILAIEGGVLLARSAYWS